MTNDKQLHLGSYVSPHGMWIGQKVVDRLMRLQRSHVRQSYRLVLEHHTFERDIWGALMVVSPWGKCVLFAERTLDSRSMFITDIAPAYCENEVIPILDRALVLEDMANI